MNNYFTRSNGTLSTATEKQKIGTSALERRNMEFIICLLHLSREQHRCDFSHQSSQTQNWRLCEEKKQTYLYINLFFNTTIQGKCTCNIFAMKADHNRWQGGRDVMLHFLQLVEVSSITKTKPRCISEVRMLYATIRQAKQRKPSRSDRILLGWIRQTPTPMEVYELMEEIPKNGNNYKDIFVIMCNHLTEPPVLKKTRISHAWSDIFTVKCQWTSSYNTQRSELVWLFWNSSQKCQSCFGCTFFSFTLCFHFCW